MRLYCYVDSLQIFVNPNVLWICKNYCTRIYRYIYVMYSNLHLFLSYISWKMEKPQIYMEMYAVSFLSFSFYILQMFIFFGLINPDYVIVNGDEKKITSFQFILDSVSCIGQCNLFMHLVFSQSYTILCVKYYESIKNFYLFKCKK